jgi:hypothetical protein
MAAEITMAMEAARIIVIRIAELLVVVAVEVSRTIKVPVVHLVCVSVFGSISIPIRTVERLCRAWHKSGGLT